jgi:hypothetical protein
MTSNDQTLMTAPEAIAAAAARLVEDIAPWARDRGADEERIARLQEMMRQILRDRFESAVAQLEGGGSMQ